MIVDHHQPKPVDQTIGLTDLSLNAKLLVVYVIYVWPVSPVGGTIQGKPTTELCWLHRQWRKNNDDMVILISINV